MNKVEYSNAYVKLMREGKSESSPEVIALNNQRMAVRKVNDIGTVDASNQGNQGAARQPTQPYSDSQINESRYFEMRVQEAIAEGKYLARSNHYNNK